MRDDEMACDIVAEEREPDTRQPRVRPVVRREHARQRVGFDDRAVLVRAITEQRRDVCSCRP
jgi:hypothetical protein